MAQRSAATTRHHDTRFVMALRRARQATIITSPGMRSVWRDCCSPPVWPPPPLIADPRRHQGRAVWIDPVVFRAIAISWNNIIIPRGRPYHRRRDDNPRWSTNDLCFPRPGFSTRRPEAAQHQGRSESACNGHDLHASASLPESAKGLSAWQANSFSTGLNDRSWPFATYCTAARAWSPTAPTERSFRRLASAGLR